jgi:hypothetical protein
MIVCHGYISLDSHAKTTCSLTATIYKAKCIGVLQLSIANRLKRVSGQILNLIIRYAIDFKPRNIALASALPIKPADGNHREAARCRKTVTGPTISPSLEPSILRC